MVSQCAGMEMGNMLPRRRQRLESGTEPAMIDDMAQRPMKGLVVSPVDSMKLTHKMESNSSLRDASNTVDAHSPRVSAQRPTAKEIAAARAARIRLGYEQDDDGSVPEPVAAKLPDGPEPTPPAQVDYLPLDRCQPCQNGDASLKDAEAGLKNSNWTKACEALCILQQLVAHHTDLVIASLDSLAPLLVKHISSLRSQLSKIAILCYGDMLSVMRDRMLPHIDGPCGLEKPSQSALCQLLLKSVSKDKKFVLEAAQAVLCTCADTLDAEALTVKLLPYAKHKNPAVRGAAAEVLLAAARRVGEDHAALVHLGRGGLLRAGAALLTDKSPAARASSRQVMQLLKDCVEQQAAASATQPCLSTEPSSDQENTICCNVEQAVLPVRPYATRSAVAAAAAAQEAAKEAAASAQEAEEKVPTPPMPAPTPSKGPTAARRLSERSSEQRGSVANSDNAGAAVDSAWSVLCAELLSASEALAVSRVVRSEAAAA
eukprot:jgi/Ulvmu1/67/UM001_0070.1